MRTKTKEVKPAETKPKAAQPASVEKPTISEYNGRPTISLNPSSRFPFTFGVGKAKLAILHIEAIKAFVKKFDVQE